MTIDLTDTVIPKSDQINADDLVTGPRTFTITEVRKTGNAEQPVAVYLAEFPKGRPFKPSKSMLRVMIAAWGKDAAAYAGQRLTLYRDAEVTFGPDKVGGIRISHMTGIDRRLIVPLTVTRGKRKPYLVEPLPADAPTSPPVSEENVARIAELTAEWHTADDARKAEIQVEVEALRGQA